VYGRAVATATGERAAMLDAIGGTPLIRLKRLADASAAETWVKLEANNPTGSY
jgi:cysteine synthase